MPSLDDFVDLLDAAAEPWTGSVVFRAEPATPESIPRIEAELGVVIPALLVELSRRSPGFGVLFASLGEDWENPGHILRLNEVLHRDHLDDGLRALPENLVVFNRAADADCVCWDRAEKGRSGEHPVVTCRADVGTRVRNGRVVFRGALQVRPAARTIRQWLDAECARLLALCEHD